MKTVEAVRCDVFLDGKWRTVNHCLWNKIGRSQVGGRKAGEAMLGAGGLGGVGGRRWGWVHLPVGAGSGVEMGNPSTPSFMADGKDGSDKVWGEVTLPGQNHTCFCSDGLIEALGSQMSYLLFVPKKMGLRCPILCFVPSERHVCSKINLLSVRDSAKDWVFHEQSHEGIICRTHSAEWLFQILHKRL